LSSVHNAKCWDFTLKQTTIFFKLFRIHHSQSSYHRILHIKSIPAGKVSILGGHSAGHSKQKKKYISTCVLFQMVSKIELFHCRVPNFLLRERYYALFLMPVIDVQVAKLLQFT
jgi:hypothetical protein